MPGQPKLFEQEALLVADLCRQAAARALHIAASGLNVAYKDGDDRSPVTEADRAANDIVRKGLEAAFPDDAICAEESPDTHDFARRRGHRRLWCIDPIDGTREFIAGSGQWSVMVGLAIDGAARFGAVYEPKHDAMFLGAVGEHGDGWATAEHRGQVSPLGISSRQGPGEVRLMVSRHQPTRALESLCHDLGIKSRTPLGSVGLKVSRIARGDADLYACLTDKIHEWDACGPAAILLAAGGQVTDLGGAPLVFNRAKTNMPAGLLASNGAVHARALSAFARASAGLPHLARLRGQSAAAGAKRTGP